MVVAPEERGLGIAPRLLRAGARADEPSAVRRSARSVPRRRGSTASRDGSTAASTPSRPCGPPISSRSPAGASRERHADVADRDAIIAAYDRVAPSRPASSPGRRWLWDERLTEVPNRYVYVVERDGGSTVTCRTRSRARRAATRCGSMNSSRSTATPSGHCGDTSARTLPRPSGSRRGRARSTRSRCCFPSRRSVRSASKRS